MANSAEIFSLMPAFEARHSAYQDFQQRMERYWCMRWLSQRDNRRFEAAAVRDDLVRLADAPLYFRAAGAPVMAPGRRLVVDVLDHDLLDLSVEARFVELCEGHGDGPTEVPDALAGGAGDDDAPAEIGDGDDAGETGLSGEPAPVAVDVANDPADPSVS